MNNLATFDQLKQANMIRDTRFGFVFAVPEEKEIKWKLFFELDDKDLDNINKNFKNHANNI
jgi:hypothetical protein